MWQPLWVISIGGCYRVQLLTSPCCTRPYLAKLLVQYQYISQDVASPPIKLYSFVEKLKENFCKLGATRFQVISHHTSIGSVLRHWKFDQATDPCINLKVTPWHCATIPAFGIRARASLSCVGGRNVGGYGCNWRVLWNLCVFCKTLKVSLYRFHCNNRFATDFLYQRKVVILSSTWK